MHEQPALAEPEIDTREIEPVLLDHQVLDDGKLLLALLVDIGRQVVDLIRQPLQRALRADEMGGEIALPLEKVPQVVAVEVHDPGVIGRRR